MVFPWYQTLNVINLHPLKLNGLSQLNIVSVLVHYVSEGSKLKVNFA